MSEYVITGCSTADLSEEEFLSLGIDYASFSYFIDGVEFIDDLYTSISPKEFYQKITDGATPTTTQVSAAGYRALWEPYLKEGKDILHLTLSSGISGTYQSAIMASNELKEEYPWRQIVVIDSLAASSGFGLLLVQAARNKEAGMLLDENAKWLENNKLRLHHWFFSTDLTSYIRGGRVSKVSGFVGSVLNICPLLNINSEGKLIPRHKCRGKKKAISEIVDMMKKHADNGEDYSNLIYISHSDCEEDVNELVKVLNETFPNREKEPVVCNIGTVIGSHTGPGTVALFFWGDKRGI